MSGKVYKNKTTKCAEAKVSIHIDLELPRLRTGVKVKKKVSQKGKSAINTRATGSSTEKLYEEMQRMGLPEGMEFKGDGKFQGKQEKWWGTAKRTKVSI